MRRSIQVAFVACVVLVVAGGAIGGGAIGGGGGGGGPFLKLDSSNGPLTGGLCVENEAGELFLALPKDDSETTCGQSLLWSIGSIEGGRIRSFTSGATPRMYLFHDWISIGAGEGAPSPSTQMQVRAAGVEFANTGGSGHFDVGNLTIKNLLEANSGDVWVDDTLRAPSILNRSGDVSISTVTSGSVVLSPASGVARLSTTTTSGTRPACASGTVGAQTMYNNGSGVISLCVCEQTGSGTYAWRAATSSGSC